MVAGAGMKPVKSKNLTFKVLLVLNDAPMHPQNHGLTQPTIPVKLNVQEQNLTLEAAQVWNYQNIQDALYQ
jgi:hypothetical protein